MQPNPQDAIATMQTQALDAIRAGQAATLEAVKNWNEQVAKFAPPVPPAPAGLPGAMPGALPGAVPGAMPQVPGLAEMADPGKIIDSVYDFAGQLLELNKQFVHQLLDASRPAK